MKKLSNKRYLIGVSGGPDSMALLDMARKKYRHIEAAHVNYHKRDSAKRDENIVRRYCRKYGIAFHILNLNPDKVKGNFQSYARIERYSFFERICNKNKLDGVLVAHHKDDHIETYLMQKERKLGVEYYGLAKENTLYGVKVYRPLLDYTKQDLIKYCEDNNIEYGIDESNLEDDYARNRIRHSKVDKMSLKQKNHLVLKIEKENKKKYKANQYAEKYLDKEIYTVKQFLRLKYLNEFMHLYFPHKSDIHIKEILRQLETGKQCIFKSEYIYLVKQYNKVSVFKVPEEYSYTFKSLKDMKSKSYKYFRLAKKGSSKNGVTVSAKDFPIIIRNCHDNDEIKMTYGTKKLNRFFIDNKIRLKDRLLWPVMVNKNASAILVPEIGCDIKHYSEKHNVFMIKL